MGRSVLFRLGGIYRTDRTTGSQPSVPVLMREAIDKVLTGWAYKFEGIVCRYSSLAKVSLNLSPTKGSLGNGSITSTIFLWRPSRKMAVVKLSDE